MWVRGLQGRSGSGGSLAQVVVVCGSRRGSGVTGGKGVEGGPPGCNIDMSETDKATGSASAHSRGICQQDRTRSVETSLMECVHIATGEDSP